MGKNNFIKKALKIPWEYEWEREMNFYHGYWITQNWIQNLNSSWRLKFNWRKRKNYLLLGKAGIGVALADKKEAKDISDEYVRKVFSRKISKKFIKQNSDLARGIRRLVLSLDEQKLSNLTNEKLAKIFDKYLYFYVWSGGLVGDMRSINWTGMDVLKKVLKRKIKDSKLVDEYANVLVSTEKKSWLSIYEKDFLESLKKIIKNSSSRDLIVREYWEKYSWIPCGFADEPALTIKRISEEFQSNLKKVKDLENEYLKKERNRQLLSIRKKNLINELKLDTRTKKLAEFLSLATYYKDFQRFVQNKWCHHGVEKLMAEITKRLKVKREHLSWLSYDEIYLALLAGKIEIDKIKTSDRRRSFAFVALDSKLTILSGKEAEEFIDYFNEKKTENNFVLKGVIANSGFAIGQVLVIKNAERIKEEKTAGRIFVTNMTTPELMPYLKNVKAIITDEGGITSHASIISRELGIPCIIGTKNATKILKDGDVVEIDANNGTIKILKKI